MHPYWIKLLKSKNLTDPNFWMVAYLFSNKTGTFLFVGQTNFVKHEKITVKQIEDNSYPSNPMSK